jgi:hypothetical protein
LALNVYVLEYINSVDRNIEVDIVTFDLAKDVRIGSTLTNTTYKVD